jgi:dolichyldiphosphatase
MFIWYEGKLLAAVCFSPLALAAAHAAIFLVLRDCHTFVFGAGVCFSHLINGILKASIAEDRPTNPAGHARHGQFGMPSSHAQFMGFYASYLASVAWHLRGSQSGMAAAAAATVLTGATVAVAIGRVYLQYHTIAQVQLNNLYSFCSIK